MVFVLKLRRPQDRARRRRVPVRSALSYGVDKDADRRERSGTRARLPTAAVLFSRLRSVAVGYARRRHRVVACTQAVLAQSVTNLPAA